MSTPELLVPQFRLDELERNARLADLDLACRRSGVFAITGHGLEGTLRPALFESARNFFGAAAATKNAVRRTADNPWGYYDAELTKNKRDAKEVFDFGPANGSCAPQWPVAGHSDLKIAVVSAYDALTEVAQLLLAKLSVNLGVPETLLGEAFDRAQTSFLRINHYPASADAAAVGVHPHTDSGALTLLLHDGRSGLEVMTDDGWRSVHLEADTLIVNLGDILQVWSNDRYRAPLHRVVNVRHRPRMSAPFFFNPAFDTVYAPLRGPARYRPIQWGEFRSLRSAGDYADLGHEVQISDYRIDN